MNQLLHRLVQFIKSESLPLLGNKVLCAVSGGMDSVVMVNLLHELGIKLEFAHANFQLRGDESAKDEKFVRELALQYHAPCHVRKFDVSAYEEKHHVSVQVAARELRYSWFAELLDADPNLKCICTAHHADDNVETVLMNFFKGTGMMGLKGIPVRQGSIIRPLLFASRNEIKEYASVKGIEYKEDSSNLSDKYTRNFFRLKVIPLISERFPEVSSNLRNNLIRFKEAEILYRDSVNVKLKKLIFRDEDGSIKIPVEKLRKTIPLQTILFEIFSQWGFQSSQLSEIIRLMDSQTGKIMFSQTHRLLKNRNWFVITPIDSRSSSIIPIETFDQKIPFEQGVIECKVIKQVGVLDTGEDQITIDADEVIFPLILRKWRAGDYFYPLGLNKKKKISRLLIDQKISIADKEKIWVLESNKKIIWVIGQRMDDRFKITPKSKKFLQIIFSN